MAHEWEIAERYPTELSYWVVQMNKLLLSTRNGRGTRTDKNLSITVAAKMMVLVAGRYSRCTVHVRWYSLNYFPLGRYGGARQKPPIRIS